MANLSDTIEYILNKMLDENAGSIEFTRNDFAEELNCVPSQITYVLRTRFTHDLGYIKESKRGGGGSITIRRIKFDSLKEHLAFQIKSMPKRMSQQEAYLVLDNLIKQKAMTMKEHQLIKAAISHQALQFIPREIIDQNRANILANMLLRLYQSE